jgi:hypothetical protein
MSLDVYLYTGQPGPQGSGIFFRENGATRELTRDEWDEKFPGREPLIVESERAEAYSANITHNLGEMASKAGIYGVLWRPDENNLTHAFQLVPALRDGLQRLKDNREYFEQFNPKNGWGDYDGLVSFVSRYLAACEEHPTADVSVSR